VRRELSYEEQDLLREAIAAYCAKPMPKNPDHRPIAHRERKILTDLSDDLRICRVSITA